MSKHLYSPVLALLGLAAATTANGQARSSLLNRTRNAAAPAPAAKNAAASEATKAENEPGKLNFVGTDLDMVLKIYGELVGKTILKDPTCPNCQITLVSREGQELTDAERIEAIEVVLEMNGVHLEKYGDGEAFVRAIARKDASKEGIPLYMSPDDPTLAQEPEGKVVSVMINFKNISAQEEAQKALEGFKSNNGLLQVFERTNAILVTDTKQNIERMLKVAKAIDIPSLVQENVFVRQIKYATAADVQQSLQKIVEDAQKYQEKDGKAQQNAQNAASRSTPTTPSLLRRPGQNNNQPVTPTSLASIIASVSDADRGMIRGRVLIVPDERSNKLIIVTNDANMKFFDKVIEALDVETTPDTVVKVYRLKYADSEDVADMINDLIGNAASSKSSSKNNTNASAKNGTGGNLTRNTPATAAAKPKASVNQRSGEAKAGELSKDNTTVLSDKRINGLVVMTDKSLVPTLEQIIESMDVKLAQVLIETCIIEVTLGDGLETGVDWVQQGKYYTQAGNGTFSQKITGYDESGSSTKDDNNAVQGLDGLWHNPIYSWVENTSSVMHRGGFVNNGNYALGGGGGTGSALLNTVMGVATNAASSVLGGANPIGSGINYLLKSDKLNLAAVIQASKTDSRAKYIASPVVMTVDNKEATIEATQNRKFLSNYQSNSSSSYYGSSVVPQYESKDLGITIKVTPKINPNGTVMLTVEEEYSQLGAKQSILDPNSNQVSIDTSLTRKASADALLENRQTVILCGLTSTRTSSSETGIPILKDIPWIGKWLFGSVSESEERSELIIFMTPYVLDDGDAAQAEALRRKNALSDASPWDDHGWSASALADPVKKQEVMRRLKDEAKKQDEERQTKLAIEKWKMDRAKALEKMDKSEREFWIETHRDELEKEEKEKFDKEMKEQADLKLLAEQIKEKHMKEANAKIDENAKELEAQNVRGQMDAAEKAEKEAKGKGEGEEPKSEVK